MSADFWQWATLSVVCNFVCLLKVSTSYFSVVVPLLWLEYHFLWPCFLKRHISINRCGLIRSPGCQVSSRVCSKWLWYCTAYITVLFSPPFSLSFLGFGSLQRYGVVDAEYCCVKRYALLVGCRAGRAHLALEGSDTCIRDESFANLCYRR